MIEIDKECRTTIGEYRIIFDGSVIAPVSEGPKAYKRNGYYYILFPAGGVSAGWQCCIRSRSVYGPYEYRVVMHKGGSTVNGPHQGGWVTAPDGSDWFLHFQDVNELGRIIHLQPMAFHDDWPMIGSDSDGDGIGEPVMSYRLPVQGAPCYSVVTSDEFDSPSLGLQWQWQANPCKSFYSLSKKESCLTLFCRKNSERENLLWYAPNALTQISQRDSFRVISCVTLEGKVRGDEAAIGMIGHLYGYIALSYDGDGYKVRVYRGRVTEKTFEGMAEEEMVEEYPVSSSCVFLRLELRKDGNYLLSFSSDGERYISARHVFPLMRATWTGAKFTLWARNRDNKESGGEAHYDFVRFS